MNPFLPSPMMESIPDHTLERFSRAVTLTVLELDVDRHALVPAYLIANLMSPALWRWREERRAYAPNGQLLGANRRLKELERHFHRYTFTHFTDQPGGDPWGLLSFSDEEQRLGSEYVRHVRQEYDETLKGLLRQNPDSQFGQIVEQDYYERGYFPRLRNEALEVMDAYSTISDDGRGSGKCAALAMLWAAALMVWGRFPPERIVLIGNRAHVFVFLHEENGHLFNNTKWFSRTRIHNASELSEFVKMVTTGTSTTFFYCPSIGMCQCSERESTIPRNHLVELYRHVRDFLSVPLRHPDPANICFEGVSEPIPLPSAYTSAQDYRDAVWALADRRPESVYDLARYAYRSLDVPAPAVYARAALRDYHAQGAARRIGDLEGAMEFVRRIPGRRSLFDSRERIQLPDETLVFRTGDDRDRALLLFTLLSHSCGQSSRVGVAFTEDASYVRFDGLWVNAGTLSVESRAPEGVTSVFNEIGSSVVS